MSRFPFVSIPFSGFQLSGYLPNPISIDISIPLQCLFSTFQLHPFVFRKIYQFQSLNSYPESTSITFDQYNIPISRKVQSNGQFRAPNLPNLTLSTLINVPDSFQILNVTNYPITNYYIQGSQGSVLVQVLDIAVIDGQIQPIGHSLILTNSGAYLDLIFPAIQSNFSYYQASP